MPQFDDFAADTLTTLPPQLVQAIHAAEMPGLSDGPRDSALIELLSGRESDSLLDSVPAERRGECLSGLWLLAGDLGRSHEISQSIENPEGSFWHAIMHRREGDLGNSKYWLRRAGPHPVMKQMAQLAPQLYSDPSDFVDACGRAARTGGADDQRCRHAQWLEWQALMAHCMSPA